MYHMDGITERNAKPSFRERVVDLICRFRSQVFHLFVIQVVLLMLLLVSLLFLEPGTASYAVMKIDFIIFVATLTPTVLILYGCNRRARQW